MHNEFFRSDQPPGSAEPTIHRVDGRSIQECRRWWPARVCGTALVALAITWMLALWCRSAAAESSEPLAPLPLAVPENAEKVALGERLFQDPRLSRQSQRSCATCHPLDRGAMDGRSRAEGASGEELRNTPTLFNVGFNFFFNWDGSVTTLEAHAEKVLSNPRIMNASWPELLAVLGADTQYAQAFSAAYPDGLTQANLVDTLTCFERSLVTPNSRFDRYLRGEKQALDPAELEGYRLFKSLGCVACHQGMNIGGNLFQKFGIYGAPTGTKEIADAGRYAVTRNDRDRGVYRVPSLRNVAVTAPYFHDGRAPTLEAAVDTMAQEQLGRRLGLKERALIVLFLKTLTGEYRGKPVTQGTEAPR
ncbi:MAG: cytochrome [Proteobacteria bacterium]|nr:cytochrome [Pseudomonadota bacterium]